MAPIAALQADGDRVDQTYSVRRPDFPHRNAQEREDPLCVVGSLASLFDVLPPFGAHGHSSLSSVRALMACEPSSTTAGPTTGPRALAASSSVVVRIPV